jgi:hypothetical protein
MIGPEPCGCLRRSFVMSPPFSPGSSRGLSMLDEPPAAMTIETILAMTDEDLAAIPPDVYGQIMEIKAQAEEDAKRAEAQLQAALSNLGQRVVGLYDQRRAQRVTLEQRWLEDLRRYNGEYDPEILKVLQNREYGSRAYVPLTRRVVNIVEARLTDLLFPTDDRNWAVDPSPVPMLVQAEALAGQLPPDEPVPFGAGGEPVPASAVALAIRELREEARSKADNMQREVDDQLRQANYAAVSRSVIHEAMVLGTGVVKGPMVLNRRKRVWITEDGRSTVKWMEDLSPTAVQTSVWDFFPDMSSRTIKDCESVVERHYMTKAEMAKLARQPGFEIGAEAIRDLLKRDPAHTRDSNRDALREKSGTQGVHDPRYLLLEYHGPVELEELKACGCEVGDDPLEVYEGIVWALEDGTVIKAVVNPMDTEERPYSVYCWEKDPGSIFGFGLSHEVADMAEAACSSFRAALDNLGLTVGPQIVVNSKLIRPRNNKWVIEPNKIWEMIKADADARAAFAFFQIDGRLNELLGVFDRSKQMIDDLAGPVMAMQGQEAPSYLDTARGASIAYNAANIWMRRAVRNWDDDVSSTLPSRFIDWNMQYNPKPEIKGDLMATARGTTALLEAEGQMTKVGIFLGAAKDVPMPFKRRINQLRAMARSMRLDAVDLLPDDAEVKQLGDKIDNAPPPTDPAVERIKLRQAEIADNAAQREHELLIENGRNQLRLAEIASREGLTMEQARQKYEIEALKAQAQLEDRREERSHQAQMLNAELASRMTTGAGV